MKIKIYLATLLIIFVISGLQTFAQNGKFSDLTLEILTTQPSFVQLEPIPILFKVSNLTDKNVPSHGTFDFSGGYVQINIRQPNGQIRSINSLSMERARTIAVEKFLPPQSHFEKTQVISLGLNSIFPEVGRYGIQAVFLGKDHQEAIRSAWLNVDILQPTGVNLAALDFLEKQTNIVTVFEEVNDENIQTLESFISSYPESDYAPYVRFLLANHYLFEEENDKAKTHLVALESKKDFVYSSKVKENLAKVARIQDSQ